MRRIRIFILVLFLMLTACQPTPKEPIVIGKDNERLIEKAKGSAEPAQAGSSLYDQLGCPRTYVLDLKNEGSRVHIRGEAPVILPEADALPLVYVQAARFDQKTVYAFFQALTAGEPMYDIPTASPKWYIEQQIKEKQASVDELAAGGRSEDEFQIRALQNEITGLQQAYGKAPEEVSLIPNDGTLKPYDMTFLDKFRGTATAVQAIGKPFEKGGAQFFVSNDADYADAGSYTFTDEAGNEQSFIPRSGSTLSYTRNGLHMGFSSGCTILLNVTRESETGKAAELPEGLTLGGYLEPEKLLLSLTPADARQQAEALLAACGVTDMAVDGVYLTTDRQNVPAEWWDPDDLEELRAQPEHQVYAVRFLRQVAGVSVESFFGVSQVKVADSGYGPEWMYEVLEVAVDDKGIQTVEWTGPLAVESVITEKAALLPFEEVRGIFERMLPIVYANYGVDKDWEIEIDHVRLCLWRIFDRDSFTRGILTPVWCFYGTVNGRPGPEFQPLLIVNAVDGSIIDPHIGY